MNLNYEEIQKVNRVQKEMLSAFIAVCEKLHLPYFMIHGSLLGAVRFQNFFPYDDDIDVAMMRKDYEILMREGQKLFPEHLFLQSVETEEEYPLPFAKLRNTETAFIQPVLKNFKINKGIYIDIFPLDFYPEGRLRQRILKLKEILYGIRISCRMTYETKQSLPKKAVRRGSVLFCPSWKTAVQKRASLYMREKRSGRLITVGGKGAERGMPEAWFGEGVKIGFAGTDVVCPKDHKAYLANIYGDYENFDPAAKYMNNDGTVTVSADRISTERSYLDME